MLREGTYDFPSSVPARGALLRTNYRLKLVRRRDRLDQGETLTLAGRAIREPPVPCSLTSLKCLGAEYPSPNMVNLLNYSRIIQAHRS